MSKRQIEAAEQIICNLFESPFDWRELVRLTGLGEKTAKSLLCDFFDKPDFFVPKK